MFERFIHWYLTRIYIHVRPERIYVWADGDASREPRLFDAHMEEVRSGHDEEPDADHADTSGGTVAWDERMEELGALPGGGGDARLPGRLPVLGAPSRRGRLRRAAPAPGRRAGQRALAARAGVRGRRTSTRPT